MDNFYNIMSSNVDTTEKIPKDIQYIFFGYLLGLLLVFFSTLLGAIFYIMVFLTHIYLVVDKKIGLLSPFMVPVVFILRMMESNKNKRV